MSHLPAGGLVVESGVKLHELASMEPDTVGKEGAMKKLLATCGLLSLLLGGTHAQATLIDRGTLIYDTVNNI